ncbi:helix-turn-helix domain-containing protein [Ulvibacterium marinum]|nr:helix-turn-helix domain-containing protein [Ulvibacterium marinum]
MGSLEQLSRSHFNLTYGVYPYLAYITIPFFTVWGPTMYLYIKAETSNNLKLYPKDLLHFLPWILFTLYFLMVFHVHSIEEKRQLLLSHEIDRSFRKVLDIFIPVQVFVYNMLSIVAVERFAKNNKSKHREVLKKIKWNRFIIYGYFIACVCNNIAKISLIHGESPNIKTYLYTSSLLFFLYFSVILGNALLGSHFGGTVKKTQGLEMDKDEFNDLNNRLETFMNQQKPFLKFNLALSELADGIGQKKRYLSRFINTYHKLTFQDYVNSYRIEEAKRLIEESRETGKTILEIVYESGFNSKSAFNFAFKKHTNTTPTAYRKSFSKKDN